jgi:hypothetical protein
MFSCNIAAQHILLQHTMITRNIAAHNLYSSPHTASACITEPIKLLLTAKITALYYDHSSFIITKITKIKQQNGFKSI